MASFIITCPICGKKYKLSTENPAGLASQEFRCKQCKYCAPMSKVVPNLPRPAAPAAPAAMPQRPAAAPSIAPGIRPGMPQAAPAMPQAAPGAVPGMAPGMPPAGGMPRKTVVSPRANSPRAFLTIVGTGVRFTISEGQYTIGRRSSDSNASIQLAPDPYMSRLHARLAAKVINGRLVVQVCSTKADNPIIINGNACPPGVPQTLRANDHLQLGMTHVVFIV